MLYNSRVIRLVISNRPRTGITCPITPWTVLNSVLLPLPIISLIGYYWLVWFSLCMELQDNQDQGMLPKKKPIICNHRSLVDSTLIYFCTKQLPDLHPLSHTIFKKKILLLFLHRQNKTLWQNSTPKRTLGSLWGISTKTLWS